MTTRPATPLLALNASAAPALCRAAPQPIGDAAEPPAEIVVVPAGSVVGDDGRRFDNADPDAVVAAFRAGGRDLPIDVEHSTHIKGPEGEPAPAVGWVTDLVVRDGALVAKVVWNAAGAELIATKAYRYVSPAFRHDAAGRVLALASVGLTNKPNLRLPALNRTEDTMDRTRLIALFALKADATDADIEAAIGVALNRAKVPDPTLYVPKTDLDAALNRAIAAEARVAETERATNEAAHAAVVDQAVKDGKIAPASRDHYLTLCREGQAETVKAMIATLPTLAPGQREKAPAADPATGGDALAEHELAICRTLGIDPKAFAAHRPAA